MVSVCFILLTASSRSQDSKSIIFAYWPHISWTEHCRWILWWSPKAIILTESLISLEVLHPEELGKPNVPQGYTFKGCYCPLG
jgi:hypothetical protein